MVSGELCIGERKINNQEPCFIIAEIGQNHQGDLNLALNLIKEAKKAGADCVKFQKSCLVEKFTQKVLQEEYTSKNSFGKTYGEHKHFLEFSDDQYMEIIKECKNEKMFFSASAMDPVSLKFLISCKVPFIKIGSGDGNNFLLIEEAAASGIPLIISTGMQDLETIKEIYKRIKNSEFAFLHCVSAYPTPFNEANIRAVTTLKETFKDKVIGYSGHEIGFSLTLAAVTLGAKIVERHLTLDKNQKGTDHCCSLDPEEFSNMVKSIKEIEAGLGKGKKIRMPSEEACFKKLGKNVVAGQCLKVGHLITKEDIRIKVAQDQSAFGAGSVYNIIGKRLRVSLRQDEAIQPFHLDM